jgi:preprotein translocase subunit SecF
MIVALTTVGSLIQNLSAELVIGLIVAVLVSDVVALELARRFWNREEAVARL